MAYYYCNPLLLSGSLQTPLPFTSSAYGNFVPWKSYNVYRMQNSCPVTCMTCPKHFLARWCTRPIKQALISIHLI